MTGTTTYFSAVAEQLREAMSRSAELWQHNAWTLPDLTPSAPEFPLFPQMSQVDVGEAVGRYFEVVQQMLGAGLDLAVQWATSAVSLSGVATGQIESIGRLVAERTDDAAREAREQADKAEEEARGRYQALTTIELSGIAVDRDLPIAGGHDELVERLVDADTEEPA